MNFTGILQELRSERDRLDQALTAIEAISSDSATRSRAANRSSRHISAAGRQRISDAAKAMWERRRSKANANKSAPKPIVAKESGRNGRMSAAARKRISQARKKWWAEHKKEATAKKTAPKSKRTVKKVAGKPTVAKKRSPKPRPANKVTKRAAPKKPALKQTSAKPAAANAHVAAGESGTD